MFPLALCVESSRCLAGSTVGPFHHLMSLQTVDIASVDVLGDALRLHLGPNLLPAVATSHIRLGPSITVVLEALAASHRVTVTYGGSEAIVETGACRNGGDPVSTLVSPDRLPSSYRQTIAHGTYCFAGRKITGQSELEDGARMLRAISGRPGSLVVGFPGHPDALTGLVLDTSDQHSLAWSSWHLYPGVDPHMIVTTSALELQEVA